MKTDKSVEGIEELMALSLGWFLEKGQFEFMQLPLAEQLSFAETYSHLNEEKLVKALRFLGAFCEGMKQAALRSRTRI